MGVLMSSGPIVAIALLTQEDLSTLGGSFQRAYPVDNVRGFDDLLRQLDGLDQSMTRTTSLEQTSEYVTTGSVTYPA